MNITLTLTPEVEKGLLARARERGLTLDAYLGELVHGEAGIPAGPAATGKERAQSFAAWARSHRATQPLSDEAMSRANLYAGRG